MMTRLKQLLKNYGQIVALLVLQSCAIFDSSTEAGLFLSRMKSQPGRVGAIAPSSEGLAKLMVREALKSFNDTEDFVVEIGPGTGSFTRVLLAQGVPADKLICVELDPELHDYMVMNFPDLQIILGDTARLEELLPEYVEKVGAIVSGVPLRALPLQKQEEIMRAYHAMLKPQGQMTQITCGIPTITVPGLERKFGGFMLWNIPPAFVWSFVKKVSA